jgi:opacity protein-like surface antigen
MFAKQFCFIVFSTACLFFVTPAAAQSDTADMDLSELLQEDQVPEKKAYTTATFKTTRLINGHSIEHVGKGVLDFKISHRFNTIDKGFKDLFGLDGATIRLGFDYGVTDWLMIGIGRSSFEKEYDGFVKVKLLRQTEDNSMPVTVNYLGSMMIQSMEANVPPGKEYYFSNRLCYANQLLIARKFSQLLSLQLMPVHVHYNLVNKISESNDLFALGIGGRIKLSKRITLNAEYYYQFPGTQMDGTTNSLSLGFDIETGGHVFQLHFTNSTGMTERTFIGRTTDSWEDGGIRFGFNISRVFTVARPKEFKHSRNKIY